MARFIFPSHPLASAGELRQTGILVPVSITVPLARRRYLERHGLPADARKQGYGLVDTGAEISAVDDRVMMEIQVPALSQIETATPHGVSFSNVNNASASLPDLGLFEVSLEGCFGCYLGETQPGEMSIIMLIGRDLLRHVVLRYDGPAGNAILESQGLDTE